MLVRDIEMAHVLAVIEPIWKTKTETADRVRGRIEAVLGWAETRGYRTGANPARWKGFLDTQLPAPSRIAPTKNHASMPIGEVAAFMLDLHMREGNGARALEFLILTNVRVANVRMATWAEVDLKEKVWTIPGEAEEGGTGQRMKTGVEFKVPLSDAAVKLLEKQPRMAGTDLIFPSPTGKVMSDMTLLAVMRRMNISPDKAVPHGFRATFKTWAAERTLHRQEVIEAAMGHKIKDKVEASYMRGNYLDKRRPLMQDWAKFVYSTEKANVLPMRRAAA
jgi:integrase